ncbi:MAG: hypothetical protein MUC53_08370 [Candidatus Contendobacter sp.]|jgi:hypothetical protein|nr:hypothetical protein [Candidatus Contendobacter sp.]
MSDPMLTRIVATYWQNQDDAYDNEPGVDQVLTLTIETAGAGPYLVVSTERWAMDHPKELHRLMKAFVAAGKPLFEKPPCLSN